MAQITINIPDQVVPRVLDAVASQYGWDENSGQTKAQFAKSVILKLLKDTVRSHESNLAARVAAESANQAVDSDIVLS